MNDDKVRCHACGKTLFPDTCVQCGVPAATGVHFHFEPETGWLIFRYKDGRYNPGATCHIEYLRKDGTWSEGILADHFTNLEIAQALQNYRSR